MTLLWRAEAPLLLASTSPTRLGLLVAAGLPVETRPPGVDERGLEAGAGALAPADLAERLAAEKARAVAEAAPDRVVIGADQVLELDGAVLHKAADVAGAKAHLAKLAGRTHALHSAVAVAIAGAVAETFVATARLTMRALGPAEIAAYVDLAGEPAVTGSVGAYRLEGLGIHLFERIEGDHSTILGLPLLPLLGVLRARGLLGV